MSFQGHASKQAIFFFFFTKRVQCGELIYNERLMDEHKNTKAKGHFTGNISAR